MLTLSTLNLWIITIVGIIYWLTIINLILIIISGNRNPTKTIAWISILIALPGIGIIIYTFFGQDHRKHRIVSFKAYRRITKGISNNIISSKQHKLPEQYNNIKNLIKNSNNSPLLSASTLQIFNEGNEKIKQLIKDIQQAKHSIHIQYYIFENDQTGSTIIKELADKARQGIKVRIIYDGVGSWNINKKTIRNIRNQGIEIYGFLNVVFPKLTSKINYRNHRKIVVIDNNIGYIGGMNIADRYTKGLDWGTWKDLHFRITGEATLGLQQIFLLDWYVVSKQTINNAKESPTPTTTDNYLIQIIPSGPTRSWRTLLQTIIYLICNAKKYIYIQSPYLIPPESLNTAIKTAALAGIVVRLMIPQHSDSKLVHYATKSYITEMLTAGVKIMLYNKGFLHSKLIISDDNISCIGSANMDFRSFENNFEVNAIVYSNDITTQLKNIFHDDSKHCTKLDISQWKKRSKREKLSESFLRIFSPIL